MPTVLALTLLARAPRTELVAVASASLALALVHPTYALFLLIPIGGFAIARFILGAEGLTQAGRSTGSRSGCRPQPSSSGSPLIVEDTAGHTPSPEEVARALARYSRELDVQSIDR